MYNFSHYQFPIAIIYICYSIIDNKTIKKKGKANNVKI